MRDSGWYRVRLGGNRDWNIAEYFSDRDEWAVTNGINPWTDDDFTGIDENMVMSLDGDIVYNTKSKCITTNRNDGWYSVTYVKGADPEMARWCSEIEGWWLTGYDTPFSDNELFNIDEVMIVDLQGNVQLPRAPMVQE